MDSPYFPIVAVFVVSLVVFGSLFALFWRYNGRKRITRAIKDRKAPSYIKTALDGYGLPAAFTTALIMMGALLALSFYYFGEWLEDLAAGWLQKEIAGWFLNSIGNLKMAAPQLTYTPFVAAGCAGSLFIGVFVGAIVGKKWGVKKAALNYHLTKSLFIKKHS